MKHLNWLFLVAVLAWLVLTNAHDTQAQSSVSQGCYVNAGVGSTASTNAQNCKPAGGFITGIRMVNTSATLGYLRLYNLAAAPTCSSATGFVESIPIPANASGAGLVDVTAPVLYATGIGFCITGGGGNNDNTNAPAGIFGVVKFQ